MEKFLRRNLSFKPFLKGCLAVLMIASLTAGRASAQGARIDLEITGRPITFILSEIERTTPYRFFYSDNVRTRLQANGNIARSASNINAAMTAALKGTGLTFEVNGNQVSILQQQASTVRVSGHVTDESGAPIIGAAVTLKSNPTTGTATDAHGRYELNIPAGSQVLVFSYLGTETVEIPVTASQTTYNVVLKSTASDIGTVVVSTGMFERDKINFTGSTNTLTGENLRMVGNSNVLQSLRMLDPSFAMLDNLEMGSDPNTMAKIELRGHGAASINAVTDAFSSDPNQPLFVLNGVEVPLQMIVDLDINKVESVTILKDAGSTAIYGSRGANGVVVVETIKPKAGEINLYYTGSLDLKAPDLSVFNMMNAREKLRFEELSGKYTNAYSNGEDDARYQLALDKLYAKLLGDIERGVDTYWLSEPVRTGLTHNHSIRVSVGQDALMFDAGAKYKNEEGVMKGSNRETWEGNVYVAYRTKKVLITNDLRISGYESNNSPYGEFSTWVNTSPYFTKRDEDGNVNQFHQMQYGGLGSYGNYSAITENIPNPLYNALLNSMDTENQTSIINNTQAQYQFTDHLRVKGGLQLIWSHKNRDVFTPSEHTKYYYTSQFEKGEYYKYESKESAYRANIDVVYGNTFAEHHSVTLNGRAQVYQKINRYDAYTAVGFPYNSKGTPNLAHSFKEESRPEFQYGKHREMNLIASVNYNYDSRYLFDFSISADGATTFGANKVYKSFWSTGIGWNINREAFARNWDGIDILKVRAITGTSGNQNIGSVSSYAVYTNFVETNKFGLGYYLSNIGNPDLPWQVSRDYGVGLDFSAKKGKYSLTLDFYYKKTDPNIVFVPQAPSTGVSSFALPMGWMENKGFDFIVAYSPIYNLPERTYLTIRVTGAVNKGKYGGMSDLLDEYNEEQANTATMRQYRSGYSPTAIWAVRSKGIDPATGEEVYIRKDGSLTYNYDASETVVVGNERPDMEGVISANMRYKNFFANVSLRYSFGSDIYNSALYNKVENITKQAFEKNQDKRALYSRWQNPGDKVSFRSISILSDSSPLTSRFIQKNNYLKGESISAGYEVINKPWLKKAGMESLKFTAYVYDIFRFETSKSERGYNYPFARSISFSVSATF
ncbi:SusC/RagA family TonB-linked outer membrane protein [Alistipes sp. OttesenSCG-928-B03]|nr:SusC/RagA family TonB-linked outer membrane protein [Alistipes sp. OttesenSCG-928-B03]